jgi:hypothetical protein
MREYNIISAFHPFFFTVQFPERGRLSEIIKSQPIGTRSGADPGPAESSGFLRPVEI